MTKEELRKIILSELRLESSTVSDGELRQDKLAVWDSLTHLQMIVKLENKTSLKFSAKQIAKMTSLETIAEEIGL